ncbi:MAG: hypothetical protein HOP19_09665 [Acidobacteria bacterium]|nr:hypothetical protein [Acidobacteriota bacterium]
MTASILDDVKANESAYQQLRAELENIHWHQWVVISQGQLVTVASSRNVTLLLITRKNKPHFLLKEIPAPIELTHQRGCVAQQLSQLLLCFLRRWFLQLARRSLARTFRFDGF